jgi:protein ImuB
MHWLAVHLPLLPLDLLRRRGFDAHQPLAVTDGEGPRPRVIMANAVAMQRGVRPGLPLPAARALAPELEAHPRDRDGEAAAMQRVAACAYGFSSLVSLEGHTAWLEIGASLRLFGGISSLRKHFMKEMQGIDIHCLMSSAATPSAAGLLARCGVDADVGEGELQRILGRLPLQRTPLPTDTLDALRGAGLRSVGDLARLPRAGLARRYSRAVTDWLDRLFGHAAEPLPAWQPPARFDSRIELPSEVDNSEALRFPLRRLLAECAVFLAGRDGGVERFELLFEHHDRITRAAVGLLAPTRDAAALIEMAEGRLARLMLPAPVRAIAIEATDLPPLLPEARDLFSTRGAPALPLPRLIERLCARLGDDAVHGIEALADHRPERAWRSDASPSPGGRGAFDTAQGSVGERIRPKRNLASLPDPLPQPLSRRERGAMAMPERPLWLLERPEPVRSGSFQVLSGPERIESGWWDDGEVRRDYYIARDAAGRRCWLFCDRGGWFLQGLFG